MKATRGAPDLLSTMLAHRDGPGITGPRYRRVCRNSRLGGWKARDAIDKGHRPEHRAASCRPFSRQNGMRYQLGLPLHSQESARLGTLYGMRAVGKCCRIIPAYFEHRVAWENTQLERWSAAFEGISTESNRGGRGTRSPRRWKLGVWVDLGHVSPGMNVHFVPRRAAKRMCWHAR